MLGILLVNIYQFGLWDQYVGFLSVLDHKKGINYGLYFMHGIFLEGKMRGLFTLLFGAGIILFTAKKEENKIPVADLYFRRMMWLLVFGLIDTYLLLWRGDVLYEYALCGMLLFVFRNLRARYLILIGLLCLYLYSFKNAQAFAKNKNNREIYLSTQQLVQQGKKLTNEQITARKEWEETLTYFPPFNKAGKERFIKDAAENYNTMHLGYADMFEKFIPATVESHSRGFYQLFWETFGTIILGMGIFKTGMFSGRLKKRTYLLIALIGLGVGISLSYHVTVTRAKSMSEYFDYVDSRSFSILYEAQLERICITLGYAALFMLFCSFNGFKFIKHALSCVGRTAISNYFLQTIICTLFFNSYGFGMWNKLQVYQLYIFVLIVWLFQITLSMLWLNHFKMGPVEWLWRSLIYKKIMPNRKNSVLYPEAF